MPEPEPLSVLYVDDEPALLEIARLFLEKTGDFRVKVAASGSEAFEILESCATDAIISDYQMPGMDGIGFLKEVRKNDTTIPFILFTGKGREEIVIQAINNGATFYLQKGGDVRAQFTELAHKIRQAVEAVRAKKELQKNFVTLSEQECALRQQEENYRAVFENTGTAMAVIDRDTAICLANSESEKMFGYSRQEMESGITLLSLFPDSMSEEVKRWQLQVLNSNDQAPSRNYDSCIVTRTGEVRNVHITLAPIPDTGKCVVSLIDTSERVRTEEALRQSETLHRTIFEISPEPITLTNIEGIVRYVSPAAIGMFGLDSENDALGTSIFDWIAPEMRERVQLVFERFIRSGAPIAPPGLYLLQKRDGTRFHAEISTSVLTSTERKPVGLVSIHRDVSNRIATEDALRKAGMKLNLLSSVTRHDILNKLTVLLGYIELARLAKEPEVAQDFLQKIDEIAGLLGQQIEFTKDYQELGVKSPRWQKISTIIAQASSEINPAGVVVTDDCPNLEIFADPLLIKVVYNLIDNALRHGGNVSRIGFSFRDTGSDLILIVEDDGEGVRLQDKEKIFSKGFGKNTGFGLFLVREILAITGMNISETGFPGRGARFEITIPQTNFRFSSRG